MPCPRWLYRRWDRRGFIPRWAFLWWPHAHWCAEVDYLLIVDERDVLANCFCHHAAEIGEPYACDL